MVNRRSLIRALPALALPRIATPQSQSRTPISMTLLRAAAGDLNILPGVESGSELTWNAVNLLHVHLDQEVGLYDWAAPELRNAAAVMPGPLQTFDIRLIEDVYARYGLVTPDRGLLSRMWAPVALADLSLITADGRAMSHAFHDELAIVAAVRHFSSGRTGQHMHPWDTATTVAGGAVLAASGVGLINIGVGVGTAGVTFASSVVASVAVLSGVALLVIGVAGVGYAVSHSLGY